MCFYDVEKCDSNRAPQQMICFGFPAVLGWVGGGGGVNLLSVAALFEEFLHTNIFGAEVDQMTSLMDLRRLC